MAVPNPSVAEWRKRVLAAAVAVWRSMARLGEAYCVHTGHLAEHRTETGDTDVGLPSHRKSHDR